jgi:A/G-specific adenine glycosylase
LEVVAGVWRRVEALLLGKRRANGLFGGLWELPCVEACEDPAEALSQALGCEVQLAQALGEVKRTLTHRDLTVRLFALSGGDEPARGVAYEDLRWVGARELAGLGMSTAMSKALAVAVQAERGARSLTGAGRGWAEAG